MSETISGYNLQFLNGGGLTADLIRNYNWQDTSLGTPDTWPDCVRAAISICLNASFPISIYIGEEYILFYNDAYIAIAGDKHPGILGKPRKMVWPENHAEVDIQFQEVMEKGISVRSSDALFPIKRFGFTEECYFDYTLSPIVDPEGKICGIIDSIMETSYRIINERRSRLLQQLSLQSGTLNSGLAVFKHALNPVQYNRKDLPFCLLYKYERESEAVLTQGIGVSNTEAANTEWPIADVLSSGQPILVELPAAVQGVLYPEDWSEACSKAMVIPLKQNENVIIAFLVVGIHPGILLDQSYRQFLESVAIRINTLITAALSIEQETKIMQRIRESEDQLQFAIGAAELATWDYNPVSNRFTGNDRLKSWFGLPPESEIDLFRATDVIQEKDRIGVLEAIQEALTYRSGGHYEIEYTIVNPHTGSKKTVKAKGRALFNEEEEAVRFSGTLQDITEEKRANMVLEQTNQRLEIALDAANLGSYDLDLSTGDMVCTEQCKANFGLPKDVVFNFRDMMSAIEPEYKDEVETAINMAILNHSTYQAEYQVYWPDGSLHWIKAHGKPTYNDRGKVIGIIGVTYEITKEIKARKELQRAYEQARLATQAAQLGTFDMNLVKGTMEWDDRCRLLFGISHHETVTYENDFLKGLHPDDKERIIAVINRSFRKELSNGDYDVEYRTVGVEDHKIRWVRAKGKVFFDSRDQPTRFIGSVLEITEQKENELRKNDFISMVSHELKTPLTSLKAYVQMLNIRSRKEGNDFSASTLDKVELQVKKMTVMINSFLNVSRLESGHIHLDKSTFKIEELLKEVIEETYQIYATHEINLLPFESLEIHADREKIGQVMTNLISNAVKYSPRGKTVTVACKRIGDELELSILDEGMGIRPQDKDHLFERFYRVESQHTQNISGFGIGLYLSAELIRLHNGQISVESEKGVGSRFFFRLPLIEQVDEA